jgi:hypothetical protein
MITLFDSRHERRSCDENLRAVYYFEAVLAVFGCFGFTAAVTSEQFFRPSRNLEYGVTPKSQLSILI